MLGGEHREVAEMLLGKARDDLAAARVLAADDDIAGHSIGFHAQQAVEKALKAVLVSEGIELPRTHSVGFLVGLLRERDLEIPEGVVEADWLTPWAVSLRYDDLPAPLDRAQAIESADAAVAWAAHHLSGSG